MATGNKITPSVKFTDEAFKPEDAVGCHLSLQVGYKSLSYSIFNIARNKYVALASYPLKTNGRTDELADAITAVGAQEALLKKNYKSIRVSFVTGAFTLVPQPFFSKDLKEKFLGFNTSLKHNDIVYHDVLKNTEACTVYAIPYRIENRLKGLLKNPLFMHHGSVLMEALMINYKNSTDRLVFLNIRDGEFDMMVVNGRRLEFFNIFSFSTPEDFIYYTLFVYEQLKLNPEKQEVILSGEVEKKSAIYSLLYKYIRNVSFAPRNDAFEYSYHFNELPGHYHYTLLNQYLCCS